MLYLIAAQSLYFIDIIYYLLSSFWKRDLIDIMGKGTVDEKSDLI